MYNDNKLHQLLRNTFKNNSWETEIIYEKYSIFCLLRLVLCVSLLCVVFMYQWIVYLNVYISIGIFIISMILDGIFMNKLFKKTIKYLPIKIIIFVLSLHCFATFLSKEGIIESFRNQMANYYNFSKLDNLFFFLSVSIFTFFASQLCSNLPVGMILSKIVIDFQKNVIINSQIGNDYNKLILGTQLSIITSTNFAGSGTLIGSLTTMMWIFILKFYKIKVRYFSFALKGIIINFILMIVF